MHYCSVNGRQQDNVAINDRALAYGDGIFTTAKISSGKIEFLPEHLTRLTEGSEYLGFSFDKAKLIEEITLLAANYQSAVLKIIVSAGAGGRGYSRIGVSSPQTMVTVHDIPCHYHQWSKQGIHLSDSSLALGLNPLLKGLKHLNRLEQVMIRAELDNSNCDDLLVADLNGNIIETSCANVFWFKGNKLYTPEICDAGVLGIYRKLILSFDKTIELVNVNTSSLVDCNAMFMCNSVMGIVPIQKYQQQTFEIAPVINFREKFLAYAQSFYQLGSV